VQTEQVLLNEKLKSGKTGQKQLTGRSPLWRLRSAMDCSVIEDRKDGQKNVRKKCID